MMAPALFQVGLAAVKPRYVDIGEQLRIRPCIPGAVVSAPDRTFLAGALGA